MISIVLADDHQVVRQGLRALLDAEADFAVVGEAADGLEAVSLVERLAPTVLVVDLIMPHLNGLETLRQVQQRAPRTRTIVLSMRNAEAYVGEALQSGAAGYVLKSSGVEDLVQAVRAVARGGRFISAPFSYDALSSYVEKTSASTDGYDLLTTREREVFQMAAEGLTSSEIAVRLGISPYTVTNHRSNLMQKLDIHNQTDLVRLAIARGILPLEE